MNLLLNELNLTLVIIKCRFQLALKTVFAVPRVN